MINIMDPDQLKEVFTKINDFQKPKSNPLGKILTTGLASHEGEKWAKHRKIINPAFHQEKLKVFYSSVLDYVCVCVCICTNEILNSIMPSFYCFCYSLCCLHFTKVVVK